MPRIPGHRNVCWASIGLTRYTLGDVSRQLEDRVLSLHIEDPFVFQVHTHTPINLISKINIILLSGRVGTCSDNTYSNHVRFLQNTSVVQKPLIALQFSIHAFILARASLSNSLNNFIVGELGWSVPLVKFHWRGWQALFYFIFMPTNFAHPCPHRLLGCFQKEGWSIFAICTFSSFLPIIKIGALAFCI